MKQRKMRLADLEALSKENAERRAECLKNLCALPMGAKAEDIRKEVRAQYPPLLDEIVIAGARTLTAKLRAPKPAVVDIGRTREERQAHTARIAAASSEIVQRFEIGAAAVELLDRVIVNGKPLGDCTRLDLIAEANIESGRAQALSAHADWLRRLGAAIGGNETVRTADRGVVLALLREQTHH